jgi:hypothetical protein
MPLQHLRSSTANKRPAPGSMSDGQIAVNTNDDSPGLFIKDAGGVLVKIGPVHIGTSAPNATPASGGTVGNSKGELWLDSTNSDYSLKTWDGTAWREIVVTSAMIKDGTVVNADISASAAIGLSKLATGALPSGITVASSNIVDGTIVNADINASAAIADTKLATISAAGKVSNSATTATSANTASAIVTRDASGNFTAGTITAALSGNASTATTLQSARTINGTSFDGSANITTANWGTARNITIGGTVRSVNGSTNYSWTLADIGAVAKAGDTLTGFLTLHANPTSDLHAASKQYVDGILAANDAMVFKGTLGTGGTYTALPLTHGVGWTIRVITAGTYAGQVAEVGDMYVSLVARTGTGNTNADWTLLQTNIDGAVVGPASSTDNHVALFNGTSGKTIKSSGAVLGSGTLTVSTSGTGLSGSGSFGANQNTNATITITSNATNANTANAIVSRDASGNFSAGTITANLTGTASAIADNTVTSAKIVDGTIMNADINASAAIGLSKLATGALPTAITVASANIVDGTIVDADVNASAAIAGTKISPNFGSQNVVTTGTSTAASLIPTGSSVPGNGVYLPAANSVGISTNGTGRLFINDSGQTSVGSTSTLLVNSDFSVIGTGAVQFSRFANPSVLRVGRAEGDALAPTAVTSSVEIGRVQFDVYDGSNYHRIGQLIGRSDGAISDTSSPGFLVLGTTPSGSTVPTERMRLDSTGRLGLGTSSPGSTLSVAGTDTYRGASAVAAAFASTGVTAPVVTGNNSGTPFIGAAQNSTGVEGSLQIVTANTPRIHIANTGLVGIGTTSPSVLLQVASPNSNTAETVAGFGNQTIVNGLQITTNGNLDWGFNALNQRNLTFSTNQLERARIDSSGTFRVKGAGTAGVTDAFAVNGSAPASSAQIDSSGRLLVGTSSTPPAVESIIPQFVSSSAGSSNAAQDIAIYNYQNASGSGRGRVGPKLFFGNSRSGTNGAVGQTIGSTDLLGNIRFAGDDGTKFVTGAEILAEVDGIPGANDMPGRLVFSTTAGGASTPTERMRITNAGRIGINVTSPTFLLELPNTATDAGGRGRANQWATYSDGRIKTDREELPYGIDAVMQLEPLRYFHHNSTINEDGTIEILEEGEVSIGLVAQDVDNIIPEVVSVPEDLTKDLCSLDYAKLNAVLVKAIQEQQAMIAELQTKVAALEAS